MCNACNNVCCGSDEFGGCGCDGCDNPDCWPDEDFDFDFDDDLDCACGRATAFQCVQIAGA